MKCKRGLCSTASRLVSTKFCVVSVILMNKWRTSPSVQCNTWKRITLQTKAWIWTLILSVWGKNQTKAPHSSMLPILAKYAVKKLDHLFLRLKKNFQCTWGKFWAKIPPKNWVLQTHHRLWRLPELSGRLTYGAMGKQGARHNAQTNLNVIT